MPVKVNAPSVKKSKTTTIDKPFIENTVHDFIAGIIEGQSTGYRAPEFRASSFPYCPILMAMADPNGLAEYKSDFYFGTGTAIHTLVQTWAARANYKAKLFGDWKCSKCGKMEHNCTKPKLYCERCDEIDPPDTTEPAEWIYEEVTVKWKGLSGHVDTILEIAPGKYIVVDYKTTRFRFNGSPADRAKFPYGANKVQITLYCALLRELFDLDIVGWVLVYIDRAQPMRGPRDYHISSGMWDIDDHNAMMKVLKWANNANIPAKKILDNRLKGILPTFDEMDEVVAMRPCKSLKKWEAWMKPKFKWEQEQFNGAGACPHLKMCIGDDEDALVDYFLDLAEDWEYGPPETEEKSS